MINGKRDWQKVSPEGTPVEEFSVPGRGKLSDIGLPDELGNVYAIDRTGRPYVAYNTKGSLPGGMSPSGFPEARANIYSQGGSLLGPTAGIKRLRDYYKTIMGAGV
jgi:hypothetical protein